MGKLVSYTYKQRRNGANDNKAGGALSETPQDVDLPAEGEGPDAPARGVGGVLITASFLIGSAGLLVAMSTDALAVLGRHLGLPLLGSIEIVQACIVVAASSAMVGATLNRTHAEVHILTERLKPASRALLARISDLLSAAFAVVLVVGSVWIASDLWGGHERTELLHIPLAPLRIVWCASAALIAILLVVRALAPKRAEP